MNNNRYLSKVFKFGQHTYSKRNECHVGIDTGGPSYLDVRAICLFFNDILVKMEGSDKITSCEELSYEELLDQSRMVYLELLKCECCRDSSEVRQRHFRVNDKRFKDLPKKIVEIYDFLISEGMQFVFNDADGEEHDFRKFLLEKCYDPQQTEFGGLRYCRS